MRIRWTAPAAADLEGIKKYLDSNYPHFSRSTITSFYEGVRSLKTMPEHGRPGLKPDTREIVFHPLAYIVTYRLRRETVEVLRIYHGAQDSTEH